MMVRRIGQRMTRLGAQRLEQIDRRQVIGGSGDMTLGPDRLFVALVLHLDRIRDLDVVAAERVPEIGPHLIARGAIDGVVLDPELRDVVDRRRAKALDDHLRLRRPHHQRRIGHRLLHRALHVVRRDAVAGADLDVDARRNGRLGIIEDRFLRDDAVRDDQELAGLGSQLGRAPGDLRAPGLRDRRTAPTARRETASRSESRGPQTDCRACPAARSRRRPRRPPTSSAAARAAAPCRSR